MTEEPFIRRQRDSHKGCHYRYQERFSCNPTIVFPANVAVQKAFSLVEKVARSLRRRFH